MIRNAKLAARVFLPLLALAALGTGSGCSTNVQGDTAAPVYLTVEAPGDQFPFINLFSLTAGDTPRIERIVIQNRLKVPGGGTNAMLDVKLDDYIVEWRRVDGGTKTPVTEVFPLSIIIPVGGSSTLTTYEVMTNSAATRSPFDQLFPFNGGIDRETGNSQIRVMPTITFRGHTLAGQPVSGGSAFIPLTFFYAAPQ